MVILSWWCQVIATGLKPTSNRQHIRKKSRKAKPPKSLEDVGPSAWSRASEGCRTSGNVALVLFIGVASMPRWLMMVPRVPLLSSEKLGELVGFTSIFIPS